MPTSRIKKAVSIALFRSLLLSFVRVYWRPRISPRDGLPGSGPCFIYGNHANRWDPFILNCFTPWGDPTAGVMTREFFRSPFLAWTLGSVDIHPTRKRLAEPHLVRTLFRLLQDGRKVVIYPEGGSRWTGRPEPWIDSTAKVFARSGVPVYPVLMRGSYATWPRWASYPRPGRAEIEVLEPMTFDRRTPPEEALARLRAPMDFDESQTPEHLRPRWAFRPACGIQKLLYRDPVSGVRDSLFTPDGTRVLSRTSDLQLTVLPDSRLRDERSGAEHDTGELYDAVRTFPLETDARGSLLYNRVEVFDEVEFPILVPHGAADASLFPDAIRLSGLSSPWTVPLADLRSVTIDRSYKLQLYLDDRMIQLCFTQEGSALGWKDALGHLGVAV